jgi:hypothetical protein
MFFSDKLFIRSIMAALLIQLISVTACASGQMDRTVDKGNDKLIYKDKVAETKKYSEYLVNIKSYSTNGGYYQNKYEKLLLSMAGEIIDGQDLDLSKESIGFYYDKRSNRTDRLFFGVDINTVKENNLDYGRFSVKLIKENVGGLVDLMYKYKSILNENEIVGIVIGFKWTENKGNEQVNIWIKKEDLHLFFEGKITQNEMYQRSTITNSAGKIILLPI